MTSTSQKSAEERRSWCSYMWKREKTTWRVEFEFFEAVSPSCECWWNEVWLHDKLKRAGCTTSCIVSWFQHNATKYQVCEFRKIIVVVEIHVCKIVVRVYVCVRLGNHFMLQFECRFLSSQLLNSSLKMLLRIFSCSHQHQLSSAILGRSTHASMQIDAKIRCNLLIFSPSTSLWIFRKRRDENTLKAPRK